MYARKKFFQKYVQGQDFYYRKIIEDILNNEESHLVCEFKEFLLYGDESEFIQYYFNKDEVKTYLSKICEYYAASTVIFPNYVILRENKYIYNNIQKKQQVINIQEEQEEQKEKLNRKIMNKNNSSDDIDQKTDILFTSNAFNSILNQTNTSYARKIFGLDNNSSTGDNNQSKNASKDLIKLIDKLNYEENKFININNFMSRNSNEQKEKKGGLAGLTKDVKNSFKNKTLILWQTNQQKEDNNINSIKIENISSKDNFYKFYHKKTNSSNVFQSKLRKNNIVIPSTICSNQEKKNSPGNISKVQPILANNNNNNINNNKNNDLKLDTSNKCPGTKKKKIFSQEKTKTLKNLTINNNNRQKKLETKESKKDIKELKSPTNTKNNNNLSPPLPTSGQKVNNNEQKIKINQKKELNSAKYFISKNADTTQKPKPKSREAINYGRNNENLRGGITGKKDNFIFYSKYNSNVPPLEINKKDKFFCTNYTNTNTSTNNNNNNTLKNKANKTKNVQKKNINSTIMDTNFTYNKIKNQGRKSANGNTGYNTNSNINSNINNYTSTKQKLLIGTTSQTN